MKKLILAFSLPLLFVFSLALNAGAQTDPLPPPRCPSDIPDGVIDAYTCQLNCRNCPEGEPGCKACDQLEVVFPGLAECNILCANPVPR